MPRHSIRLPQQWSRHVKSGILHAVALASVSLAYARGRATGERRLRAQFDQATSEVALLREELSIKGDRWERSHSRRRPHYTPIQRMRILLLRAARGWTSEKTARVFLVDEQTLLGWMSQTRIRVRGRPRDSMNWQRINFVLFLLVAVAGAARTYQRRRQRRRRGGPGHPNREG